MTLDPKALEDAEIAYGRLIDAAKTIEAYDKITDAQRCETIVAAYLAGLSKEVQASEVVGWRDAAERLLSVFDEQALILQRIIVGGRSDTVLREEGNKAITDLRAALATPPDTDGTKMNATAPRPFSKSRTAT